MQTIFEALATTTTRLPQGRSPQATTTTAVAAATTTTTLGRTTTIQSELRKSPLKRFSVPEQSNVL